LHVSKLTEQFALTADALTACCAHWRQRIEYSKELSMMAKWF